jgi:hypothetical protein
MTAGDRSQYLCALRFLQELWLPNPCRSLSTPHAPPGPSRNRCSAVLWSRYPLTSGEFVLKNRYVGEWSPRVRLEAATPHGISQLGSCCAPAGPTQGAC